ncbi:MAG: hypothetical protein SFU98_14720 [Leptospiraceae bacterium]|nr:hypothetical protein [Leptospiraceae bacterium]
MESLRKPFQGTINIIRFNWHFYVIAVLFVVSLLFSLQFLTELYRSYLLVFICLASTSTILSLLASLYVYDLSNLYSLDWILKNGNEKQIININAGFDETSEILQKLFSHSKLQALDFYDSEKHTEISIERARKAYKPYPNTKKIQSDSLGLEKNSIDKIFVILSAHEIRDNKERVIFFKELKKILAADGQIYVTEHLRDWKNFIAYNIGFFHFYSKKSWLKVFTDADLNLVQEINITPFIKNFVLEKNGNTT